MPDLQRAWVLLSQSAVLRSNHTTRILPPSASEYYSSRHDKALWETFCRLLSAEQLEDDQLAQEVASLPGGLGGLGLRSSQRTAPAAYWASYTSALAVFTTKDVALAEKVLKELEDDETAVACVQEAQTCLQKVQEAGGAAAPTWCGAT